MYRYLATTPVQGYKGPGPILQLEAGMQRGCSYAASLLQFPANIAAVNTTRGQHWHWPLDIYLFNLLMRPSHRIDVGLGVVVEHHHGQHQHSSAATAGGHRGDLSANRLHTASD